MVNFLSKNPNIDKKNQTVYKKFDKKSKKMYLTDVFQKIIESKLTLIYGVKYNSKWMEIDNLKDYKILIKNF